MTQKVRIGEELNEVNLIEFLHEHEFIPRKNHSLRIEQYNNGFSNLTYLVEVGDQAFVLRRPPAGAIKRGHDMGREYKVLSKLYKVFPKAPEAYLFCEDEHVIGSSFYLMERVQGIVLTNKEAIDRNISPEGFSDAAESWLDTLIELHNVHYEDAGLADLGRPEGYVERQVNNWGKQYLRAATQEVAEAAKVIQWMHEKQPRHYSHSLIHNDFKYNNVIYEDDSWQRISAVLDWEMCTLGDPLMDFGTSLAYWLTASDDELLKKALPESATAMPGNPGREELVQKYEAKSGRQINDLVFYYVYGLFKIAVIVQQIFYRYHHGYTNDERFANLDQAAVALLKIGWKAIQRQRIE